MSEPTNPHIAERLFGQPHAITPAKLQAIVWALGDRVGASSLSLEPDAATRSEFAMPQTGYEVTDGVAVVPVHGTLIQRGSQLAAQSGLVGYDRLADSVEAAAEDPAVGAILLDIDSGGGEVAGLLDTADRIKAVADKMPMAALANEQAASAAYVVAAAAGRVWATQGAAVGSIGVILAHVDRSAANQAAGLNITELTVGEAKGDGSPNKPLGEDEESRIQALINETAAKVVSKVAAFRGVPEKQIRDLEAAVFVGRDRFNKNLADAQHTLGTALQVLASESSKSSSKKQGAAAMDDRSERVKELATEAGAGEIGQKLADAGTTPEEVWQAALEAVFAKDVAATMLENPKIKRRLEGEAPNPEGPAEDQTDGWEQALRRVNDG